MLSENSDGLQKVQKEIEKNHHLSQKFDSLAHQSPKNTNSPYEFKSRSKREENYKSSNLKNRNEFRLATNPQVKVSIEPSSSLSSISSDDATKNQTISSIQLGSDGHLAVPIQHNLINLFQKTPKGDTSFPDFVEDILNKPGREQFNPSIVSGDQSESKKTIFSKLKSYFDNILQPSNNKLALKLFGSKRAVLKEKIRQQKIGRWIIHPCSNFRFVWDLVMLVLLIANVIILPVAISFFNDYWNHPGLLAFNLISDTMFMLDIIIKFRTGILRNNYGNEIILRPKKIAKHYIKTWFLIDLLSSIPFDYIFLLVQESDEGKLAQTGRAFKALRLIKLLSLLRLLRLSRLVRYLHQWERILSVASMVMRIFKLVGLIILLAHWNGCLQFLVPMLQSFPAQSWIALNKLENATWTEQYSLALFKALSHMLCIGYGRYAPQTYTDMWLTILSMVTGAMCYAVTIGLVSALIQSYDPSRRMYNQKYKLVREYMAWRKFPRELRNRITDYYEHRYQGKMFDEDEILNEISEKLKFDIINHNCRSLISSAPLFAQADQNFISDLLTKLNFEVYQPGDMICREGTIGTKMYFIQEGKINILKTNNEIITTLGDGSFFGEICLLTRATRVASCQAVTYCNLYSLSVDHFYNVLDQYPIMRQTMESVATERLSKLGKNPSIIGSQQNLKIEQESLENFEAKDTSNLPKIENKAKHKNFDVEEQASL